MSSHQDSADNTMLELFRAEVEIHTQTLNEGLLALERDPGHLRHIEPLMRAAHSIKGAARIVGVEDGVRIAHALEDCLVAAQTGQLTLTRGAIDSLLRGVDALLRIASPNQASPSASDLDAILAQINSSRSAVIGDVVIGDWKKDHSDHPSPITDHPSPRISVPDRLDKDGAERLRRLVVEQRLHGGQDFHLDLSRVDEVGIEGLTLLAALARPGQVGSLHLTNVPDHLLPLFQHTRLLGG
jgi:two-component system sensor histidine kinase and response regulator WspE